VIETNCSSMNRREFLKSSAAAGLFVFFSIHAPALGADSQPAAPSFGGHKLPDDFNSYLRIAPDGRVICYTGKIEMGQGVHTSLQQMLAEEMDLALENVDIVMGDTSLCPWDMGTFGSMTTRFFGPALRKAGAEARQVLLEMAAEKMKVPIASLDVENGTIFNREKPTQKMTYGQLTHGEKLIRTAKSAVQLKQPGQFKVMSIGVSRKDGPDKVTGAAKYSADVVVPGMLYAKIVRPPTYGSSLISADTTEAEKIKGIRVVREKDFVAILHEKPDVAARALSQVKAKFSAPPSTLDEVSVFDFLLKNAPQPKPVVSKGNVEVSARGSKSVIERTYYNDYVAHAPIEPHAAVVKFDKTEATVWASSQTPFMAQEQVAKELGLNKEKVRVMPVFVGGGFGGKSNFPQIIEAARCARLSGKPVQVAWTREEEFFYDKFRPAAIVKIKSALGPHAKIQSWDFQVYYAGDRGADLIYDVPNVRSLSYGSVMEIGPTQTTAHPFAVGPWRAPGANTNTFARESHIDLLAEQAKQDPVQFRLNHLTDPKHRNVLSIAAEKFGWKSHHAVSGKGHGVSCGLDAGTFVATFAEVAVDRGSGAITVKRVVCVQDMGMVVNPRGAKVQMEGSIIMGLGYALKEMMHFKNGQFADSNFGSYEIPRFSWLPKIETEIIADQSSEAQGGGEPSIINIGAVIANAVYDAIGVRLFQLPMTPERVLAALEKS